MRFSLEFRAESLLFLAFIATVPLYSPNMVMFTKGFPYSESFMPYFIYTLLGLASVGGIVLGMYSGRHSCERLLKTPMVFAATTSYLVGYILFMIICGVEGAGSVWLSVLAAALLAFGTLELGIAWGVYLATYYDLKHALIWIGVMVGASSVLQLLLSSVTFQVGAVVFFVLIIAGVSLPCYVAWKGDLASFEQAFDFDETLSAKMHEEDVPEVSFMAATGAKDSFASVASKTPTPSILRTYFITLRSMAKVLIVPFIGLLVFAYVMGVRKYILFDLIYVEILGGIGGAFLAVCLCFVKRAKPLLPFIYQVAMPIFALVIIVFSTLSSHTVFAWIYTCLSYVFFGAIGVFSLASLCAMAHAKEFSPVLIYGSTTAAFALASMAGLACGTLPLFLGDSGEVMLNLISTCYFAFLLVCPLLTSWKKIRSFDVKASADTDFAYGLADGMEDVVAQQNYLSQGANDSDTDGEVPDVATRCLKVAELYKLSPRETEIFGYLGRGHGIVFIAETLVISESTVRTHVKNIYKKIGVSSREELLQLVDENS